MGLTGWELDSKDRITFTFLAISDQQCTLARQRIKHSGLTLLISSTVAQGLTLLISTVQGPSRDYMARISSLSSLKS